jgi:hypothetical protein
MENRVNSGLFSGYSILFLIVGIGFLCVGLLLWWFTHFKVILLFGLAMLFGGFANSLSFVVLNRMDEAGYKVGYWRWFSEDVRLYSEYWRIAHLKGWSRSVLSGALVCFLLAAAFLLSIPIFGGNVFGR